MLKINGGARVVVGPTTIDQCGDINVAVGRYTIVVAHATWRIDYVYSQPLWLDIVTTSRPVVLIGGGW